MRVYLCGPMDWCSEEEASGWRKAARLHLQVRGIVALDPMDRPTFNAGSCGKVDLLPSLVEDDKADIEAADVLLVNYSKVSAGTSMEILLAWQKDKRVVIVAPEGLKLSPWVVYHSHKICHTMEDAYDDIVASNRRLKG